MTGKYIYVVRLLVFAGFLLAGSIARAQTNCTSSTPGNPCFSDVNDFLSGQRTILAADDVAFLTPRPGSPATLLSFANTTHLNIGSPTATTVSNYQCALGRGTRARLFNTTHDWFAAIVGDNDRDFCGNTASLVWGDSAQSGSFSPGHRIQLTDPAPVQIHIVRADVDQDGLEDLIVYSTTGIKVFTAVDGKDAEKGLKQALSIPYQGDEGQLAVGDFNGDGAEDFILPIAHSDGQGGENWDMYAFSVCPSAGYTLLSKSTDPAHPPIICTAAWQVYNAGQVGQAAFGNSRVQSSGFYTLEQPRLAAGDFVGAGSTGLAAEVNQAHSNSSKTCSQNQADQCFYRNIQIWKFNAALRPELRKETRLGDGVYSSQKPRSDFIRAVRLHASGNGSDRDQLAIAEVHPDVYSTLEILLFHNEGTPYTGGLGFVLNPDGDPVVGLDRGRFDPRNHATSPNYDNQLVVVTMDNERSILVTYSVDQSWHTHSSIPTVTAGGSFHRFASVDRLEGLVHSLDRQGRSALVGPPYKVTLENHYQPDLVLGIPPMHIDYISNAAGGQPAVHNFTVLPSSSMTNVPAFNTQ
jgi:hypothetical protein